ncbi:hypothetical protein A9Q83_16585 [Alphaproteobacteria bacterium 46_93_T64]|nr:hypothetical protein A9Q83_16585 [Alphaproteobacteria bacterium 46_93_T64]
MITSIATVQSAEYKSIYNPLYLAASKGDIVLLKRLIDQKIIINSVVMTREDNMFATRTCEFYSPLYQTAANGHLEATKLLIGAGANLDKGKSCSSILIRVVETPLTIAARNGQLKIVELLLDAGAKINIRSSGGAFSIGINRAKNPVDEAVNGGYADIARLLLSHSGKADFRKFIKLVSLGDLSLVHAFLAAGSGACTTDPVSQQNAGEVALKKGYKKIADFLKPLVATCPNGKAS